MDFQINRYPILTIVGYVIAKENNYSEALSKSLGVALANQYACWKSGSKSYGKAGKNGWNNEDRLDAQKIDYDILQFCGETFIKQGDLILGSYYREKPMVAYPDKFEVQKEKVERIKTGSFNKLIVEIKKRLKNEGQHYALAPFGKLFFAFWRSVRDDLRTREFYFNQKGLK